ncbi:hypothetical protein D3C77_668340 [compost metagenome]
MFEVDNFGALLAGHAQPVIQPVDGEYARGAKQLGAGNGELADRAAAEDRHAVAGGDFGHFGTEIAGGENVRNQNRLLVTDVAG